MLALLLCCAALFGAITCSKEDYADPQFGLLVEIQ